jgi:hypothetical protein
MYCVQVDAIVFLVDAADPERFNEAKKELDVLLSEDYLSKVLLHSCACSAVSFGYGCPIPSACTWELHCS